MRKKNKKIAWLAILCMLFSVFTGFTPSYKVQAAESLAITIDAEMNDWQALIDAGKVSSLGHGSSPGFQSTTASALYIASDSEYLYYFVESQVPNWGEWGTIMDLALYIEGQSQGKTTPPWSRAYEYSMSNLPQYHVLIQNKANNGVAQAKFFGPSKEEAVTSDDVAANTVTGYEGKIKLADLGITTRTTVHPIVVITGNGDSHGAFNVIPESSDNGVATEWNQPKNEQNVYATPYLVTIPDGGQTTPQYISPEVTATEVIFRYYNKDVASANVAGAFNGWKEAANPMTLNPDTNVFELSVTKAQFTPGKNPYKFTVPKADGTGLDYIKDDKCKQSDGDNSAVLIADFEPTTVPQVKRGGETVLPNQGASYNENQTITQVNVTYALGGNTEGAALTDNKLVIPADYKGKTIEIKVSFGAFTKTITSSVVDILSDPAEYISPEVKGAEVTFRYYEASTSGAKRVRVAGSFNSWGDSKDELKKNEQGTWEIILPLKCGKYQYKFIVGDSDWRADPKNTQTQDGNSLVTVAGLAVQGNQTDVQKDKALELIGTGIIYNEDGSEQKNIPITYEKVGTGLESLSAIGGKTQLLVPKAYVGNKVQVKAIATVGERKYEAIVDFNVVSDLYTYTINYLRPQQDYEGWNLWLWPEGGDGLSQPFTLDKTFNLKDDQGSSPYNFKQAVYQLSQPKLNFITRKSLNDNDWAQQDANRFITMPVGQKNVEIWLIQGDDTVYYAVEDVNLSARVSNAFAESNKEILVTLNKPAVKITGAYLKDKDGTVIPVKGEAVNKSTTLFKFTIADGTTLQPDALYEVGCDGYKSNKVAMRRILDNYYYEGNDLGLTYSASQSGFKVWAPTATDVKVIVYEDADIYNPETGGVEDHTIGGTEYVMAKDTQGVWQGSISGQLDGKYYMYKVTFADGTINYAVDPYARSTSANGQRTAIIDLEETNPSGWSNDTKPPMVSPADSILYELHVRDMSIDPEMSFQNKGKFKAFTETGVKTPGGNTAGIDHLKELGVTHIHLMPAYDFATVDEKRVDDENYTGRKFNWGYDPQNYNVPEGAYATDTDEPKVRVIEFKEMVAALHKNDMRVVMDVVYNHTFDTETGPFNKIVPGYYYRTHDDGKYANGSGCGNEVASERSMVRKYIKDSVKYWATEYNVDGFRFDLMGLIDTKTMEEITKEVKNEVDSDILIYGEPWQAGGSVLESSLQTVKGSQKGKGFAVFNDEIRGAIKGDSDKAGKGFATGELGKEKEIVQGIKGAPGTISQEPTEVITYVTAHDNLNLWDKVIKTQGLEASEGFIKIKDGAMEDGSSVEAAVNQATIHSQVDRSNIFANETVKMSLLANGIALTSQGLPFLHAGDEMLRSKYGDHNSYRSPDAVNMMRWSLKDEFAPIFEYYQGLINLRKIHPAFRMEKASDVTKYLNVFKEDENIVGFTLKDNANGDRWKNIVVLHNANKVEKEITLPHAADWKVVVNDSKAGTVPITTLSKTTQVKVPALAMMVLYDEAKDYEAVPTTIELDKTKVGVEVGGKAIVKAIVKDQEGATMVGTPIIWKAEDETIATVTNGTVMGKAIGETQITVTCGSLSKTLAVAVVDKLNPTKLSIVPSKDFVYVGMSIGLVATVLDQFDQEMTTSKVTWTSDTPSLATVAQDGKVVGVQEGMAKITAKIGTLVQSIDIPVKSYEKRYVVLEYNRPDKNYENWNIWTWNTGVTDGQIDFIGERDGKAVAYIEVGPETKRMGFVLRKGSDWAEGSKDVDGDRFIDIKESQTITKVQIESKKVDFVTLSESAMPVIKPVQRSIVFTYRNNELFKEGKMNTLAKVQVEINSKMYDMTYNPKEEWFEYTYTDLEEGKYLYSYHITDAKGEVAETLDKYNPKVENNKSILEYKKLNLSIAAGATPGVVDYNDNSVVELKIKGETDKISKIYIDLSAVGGQKVEVDTDLMAVSIAIKDTTVAGRKTLPIEVLDEMNNVYNSSVTLEVKARTYENTKDFDWDEAVIYFMVTDRFKNGDTSNDDPYGIGYDKKDPGTYHGGDFKGVTQQLDYLKDLGINTIWVSPIVENIAYDVRYNDEPYLNAYYGYHGYWAKDFERLNPHLGTLEEFHTLIDQAHAKGIKIMVDVVINHAGYGMDKPVENAPAHYPTDADRSKLEGMLREKESSDEVTGQLSGLPDFMTEKPEIRNKIINWQVAWVDQLGKTAKGNTIDYFRVDTVKHVEDDTWMAFKNELTKAKPDFKMIGEAWGANVDNNLGYLNTGMMDSVLDFSFKDTAKQFVNGDLEGANKKLQERNSKLDNTAMLGNFLSSHDEDGFLYSLGGNKDKFKVAAALQITAKGQPVVYYGEELGYSGANDYPYYHNRPDIDWAKATIDNDLLSHYKKILGARETYSKVFAKGTRSTLGGSNSEGYIAFERAYKGESVVVALNLKEDRSVTLKVPFDVNKVIKDIYSGKEYTVAGGQMLTFDIPAVAQGGTVILALKDKDTSVPPDTGNGGGSGSNSSSGSSGGAPTQPKEDTIREIADKEIEALLKAEEGNGAKDTIEVKGYTEKMDRAKTGAKLSTQSYANINAVNKNLCIDLGSITVTLPAGIFTQEMLANNKYIIIKQEVASNQEAQESVAMQDFNRLGNIFNIQVILVDANGKEEQVTHFNKPLQMTIKLEDKVLEEIQNAQKVGAYYIREEGTIEFMGGYLKGNEVTFEASHLSRYVVMEYAKTFADVTIAHWAKDAIEVLASRHITTGVTEDTFSPKGTVTRAEFATFLGRALGLQTSRNTGAFTDIQEDNWYSGYVIALEQLSILPPTMQDTFKPEVLMTREEMAYMIAQAYAYLEDTVLEEITVEAGMAFKDEKGIANWARKATRVTQNLGIIGGKPNGIFAPQDKATRAETAKMIIRLLEVTNKIPMK